MEFSICYALLVFVIVSLIAYFFKTGFWRRHFLFFMYFLSFSVLNVAGMYSLFFSIYISVPDVISPGRALIGFYLIYISFICFLPLYLWSDSRQGRIEMVGKINFWKPERGGLLTVSLLWLVVFFIVVGNTLRGGQYPLVLILKGYEPLSANVIHTLRTEHGFIDFHWFNIGFYYLPIFLTAYTFILKLMKYNGIYTIVFIVSLFLSIILSILFLFKGQILWLFITLVIAKVLAEGRIKSSTIAIFAIAIITVVVFYKIYYPVAEPLDILRMLVHRILEAYTMNSGVAFGVFPDLIPFYGGVTISNPGSLLPYEHVNLSSVIFYYLYGGVGGAPVPHAVEGYVNFGYIGLVLFAVFAQYCVFVLDILINSMRRDAFTVALCVFGTIWVMMIAMNSIFYGLLDLTVITTFLILLVVGRGVVPALCDIGRKRVPWIGERIKV